MIKTMFDTDNGKFVLELIPFLPNSFLDLLCHWSSDPLSLIKDLASPKTRTDIMIAVGIVTVIGTKRYERMKHTDIPESTDPGNKER
jgi:hypothetical protein